MKIFGFIFMVITAGFGGSSFGAASVSEEQDRLGRVAALRLALPDAHPPRGIKRGQSPEVVEGAEAKEEGFRPKLRRAGSAPGSGGRRAEKRSRRSPQKLQDILNLFAAVKEGSPEKEKLMDRLDGLSQARGPLQPQKRSKRDLFGRLK